MAKLDASSPEDYGAATNYDLARFLGIPFSSFQYWQPIYPEFKAAVKRAKRKSDGVIENSVYARAQDRKVTVAKQKVAKDGQIVEVIEEIHLPADMTAASFWLRNRHPEDWNAKQNVSMDVNANFPAAVEAFLAAKGKIAEDPEGTPGDEP